MIELIILGNLRLLVNIKDIKQVKEFCDQRYPSIKSLVLFYNGEELNCYQSYDKIKKLIINN